MKDTFASFNKKLSKRSNTSHDSPSENSGATLAERYQFKRRGSSSNDFSSPELLLRKRANSFSAHSTSEPSSPASLNLRTGTPPVPRRKGPPVTASIRSPSVSFPLRKGSSDTNIQTQKSAPSSPMLPRNKGGDPSEIPPLSKASSFKDIINNVGEARKEVKNNFVRLDSDEKMNVETKVNTSSIIPEKAHKIWQDLFKRKPSLNKQSINIQLKRTETKHLETIREFFNQYLLVKEGSVSWKPSILRYGFGSAIYSITWHLDEIINDSFSLKYYLLLSSYVSSTVLCLVVENYANDLLHKYSLIKNKYDTLLELFKVCSILKLIVERDNSYIYTNTLIKVDYICNKTFLEVLKDFKVRDFKNFEQHELIECYLNLKIALIQYLTKNTENELLGGLRNSKEKTFNYDGSTANLIEKFKEIIKGSLVKDNFLKKLGTLQYPNRIYFKHIPDSLSFYSLIGKIFEEKHESVNTTKNKTLVLSYSDLSEKQKNIFSQIYNVNEKGIIDPSQKNDELTKLMNSLGEKLKANNLKSSTTTKTPYLLTLITYYLKGLNIFKDRSKPSISGSSFSNILYAINVICTIIVNLFQKTQAVLSSEREKYISEYNIFQDNLDFLNSSGMIKIELTPVVGQKELSKTVRVGENVKIINLLIAKIWNATLKERDINKTFSTYDQEFITMKLFNSLFYLLEEAKEREEILQIPLNRINLLAKKLAKEINDNTSRRWLTRLKKGTFKTAIIKGLSSETIIEKATTCLGDLETLFNSNADTPIPVKKITQNLNRSTLLKSSSLLKMTNREPFQELSLKEEVEPKTEDSPEYPKRSITEINNNSDKESSSPTEISKVILKKFNDFPTNNPSTSNISNKPKKSPSDSNDNSPKTPSSEVNSPSAYSSPFKVNDRKIRRQSGGRIGKRSNNPQKTLLQIFETLIKKLDKTDNLTDQELTNYLGMLEAIKITLELKKVLSNETNTSLFNISPDPEVNQQAIIQPIMTAIPHTTPKNDNEKSFEKVI